MEPAIEIEILPFPATVQSSVISAQQPISNEMIAADPRMRFLADEGVAHL
jgi:hypothetical protein